METSQPDTGPHRIELPKWMSFAPFENLLQMKLEMAEEGESRLSMPFLRELSQGVGLMHGGALVSLADTACCLALKTMLPENVHFATIDMSCQLLYPVTKGRVEASARVVSREGRTFATEAVICTEEGREAVRFKATFKVAKTAKI